MVLLDVCVCDCMCVCLRVHGLMMNAFGLRIVAWGSFARLSGPEINQQKTHSEMPTIESRSPIPTVLFGMHRRTTGRYRMSVLMGDDYSLVTAAVAVTMKAITIDDSEHLTQTTERHNCTANNRITKWQFTSNSSNDFIFDCFVAWVPMNCRREGELRGPKCKIIGE